MQQNKSHVEVRDLRTYHESPPQNVKTHQTGHSKRIPAVRIRAVGDTLTISAQATCS